MALALFKEARIFHRRMMFAEARAKYEEALISWEHPELRLYLARVLRSIGLPVLAYDNLRLALRWGPGSLDADKEQEARAVLRALVAQELAAIEIRCDEPGATVLMDGKPWFVGPSTQRQMVTPGEHVITARKDGYFTVAKPVVMLAGKEASGQLVVRPETTVTTPRWPAWLPWATVAAGVAVAATGSVLMWDAESRNARDHLRNQLDCGSSCEPSDDYRYDASVNEGWLATGTLLVGGATALTGAVMLFMNGPQSYRNEERGDVKIEIRPAASPGAAMVTVRFVL